MSGTPHYVGSPQKYLNFVRACRGSGSVFAAHVFCRPVFKCDAVCVLALTVFVTMHRWGVCIIPEAHFLVFILNTYTKVFDSIVKLIGSCGHEHSVQVEL